MAHLLDDFLRRLATERAILVSVRVTRGSVPREAGSWMAVFAQGQVGTIGGGHLEWDALRGCREQLRVCPQGGKPWAQDVVLGPALGQCCGGALALDFEPVSADDAPDLRQRLVETVQPVALFGGGHVGRAIVQALAPLPFAVTWVDSRDEVFPAALSGLAATEHSDPVHAAVGDLPAGALVLIMSFSHAEDLDIVAACLQRQRACADLPFVGLIGSQTKWASFRSRLEARGFAEAELAHVTCPIGLPGIRGKEPAVIAASVVAQLLQVGSSGKCVR
ncbi:xanthine dehydrogenase accessory protein XdhC [Hydrogenophaga sp.]|uniref:xanthine dehydrogenase accessory protein XdhC n=1 Tax=Hydrogenophaga sp. TaxID=1904254 RepID=UPI0025C02BD9|nr:xanthine dehydrogenase accessory protein XdhC [Hydrogenophaga sp.]